ncbi:hypothetical protein GCM10027053_44780 [Intrasporangium mesophilum]
MIASLIRLWLVTEQGLDMQQVQREIMRDSPGSGSDRRFKITALGYEVREMVRLIAAELAHTDDEAHPPPADPQGV